MTKKQQQIQDEQDGAILQAIMRLWEDNRLSFLEYPSRDEMEAARTKIDKEENLRRKFDERFGLR